MCLFLGIDQSVASLKKVVVFMLIFQDSQTEKKASKPVKSIPAMQRQALVVQPSSSSKACENALP